ncbi:hypothetical protein [Caballeronia mineralivorans]|uniref:hypothetical protein n=1 Tax=Caballeronia mineralivorans TaxID=2010198 RepID=UPI003A599003
MLPSVPVAPPPPSPLDNIALPGTEPRVPGAATGGVTMHPPGPHATTGGVTTAPTLRGTAFGVFNLACGLCMLVASALAGWLWDRFGSSTTFLAGAALVVVPLLLCWYAPRQAALRA